MKVLLRSAIAVLATSALATSLSACGSSGSGSNSSGSINIRGIFSLSGTSQVYGTGESEGAKFAVSEVNAAGGIGGRKVSLKIINDNTDVSVDQSRMRELVADKSVLGALGPTSSNGGVALKPLIKSTGIPMITNVGATAVTNPIIPSLFRVYDRTDYAAAAAVNLLKSKGLTRVAMIYPKEAFGQSLATPTKAAAEAAGVTITADAGFDPNSSDFSSVVLKAKESNPQAYLTWDGSTRTPRILLAMKAQGIDASKTPIVGSPQIGAPDTIKVAGQAVEGAIYFGQLAASDPAPGVQTNFVEAWKKAHGGTLPSDPNELGYSAAMALMQAMKDVVKAKKKLTRESITDALNHLTNFATPFASLTYTPSNHDGIAPGDVRFNVVRHGVSVRNTASG